MSTPWTAIEFFASRVAEEARRQKTPLSDLEEKMLFFSEVEKSLPDINDVAEKFGKAYDDEEYEAKVSALLRSAYERDRDNSWAAQKWQGARKALEGREYYILVLLDLAFGDERSHPIAVAARSPGDQWKLLATGLIVAVLGSSGFYAFWWAKENLAERTLILAAGAFLLLLLWIWAVWGKKPFERVLDWVMQRLDNGFGE